MAASSVVQSAHAPSRCRAPARAGTPRARPARAPPPHAPASAAQGPFPPSHPTCSSAAPPLPAPATGPPLRSLPLRASPSPPSSKGPPTWRSSGPRPRRLGSPPSPTVCSRDSLVARMGRLRARILWRPPLQSAWCVVQALQRHPAHTGADCCRPPAWRRSLRSLRSDFEFASAGHCSSFAACTSSCLGRWAQRVRRQRL